MTVTVVHFIDKMNNLLYVVKVYADDFLVRKTDQETQSQIRKLHATF